MRQARRPFTHEEDELTTPATPDPSRAADVLDPKYIRAQRSIPCRDHGQECSVRLLGLRRTVVEAIAREWATEQAKVGGIVSEETTAVRDRRAALLARIGRACAALVEE